MDAGLRCARGWIRIVCVTGLFSAAPLLAHARPPGGGSGDPLVGFGWDLLDFISGTLGPIILGLGIAIAAVSWILGSRDGLQRAFIAGVGGALLLGVRQVIDWVSAAAGS